MSKTFQALDLGGRSRLIRTNSGFSDPKLVIGAERMLRNAEVEPLIDLSDRHVDIPAQTEARATIPHDLHNIADTALSSCTIIL